MRRRHLLGLAPMLLAGGLLLAPRRGRARTNQEGGVAVRGTDVVAYATEGRARPGRPEFAHDWQGARWLFATAAHRDAFAADPARYAPAYGGFCAFAVSEGYTAAIDPEAWRIVGGRLFLNHDRGVHRRWERDMARRIAQGDANWPRLAGG